MATSKSDGIPELDEEFPSLMVSANDQRQGTKQHQRQQTLHRKENNNSDNGGKRPVISAKKWDHEEDVPSVIEDQIGNCHCPSNLLLQANKSAISHSTHCPEFRCSLCRSNFSSNFVLSHIESSKHKEQFRAFVDDLFFVSLPLPPDSVRDDVLSAVLRDTAHKNVLENQSLTLIHTAIDRLNDLIRKEISSAASVRLFGSVLTGTAIRRRSDVNLDLVIQRSRDAGKKNNEDSDSGGHEENAAQILSRIADLMQRNESFFPTVERDFSSTCPRVKFSVTDPETGKAFSKVRSFEILLSGQRTLQTSKLVYKYMQLDERVRVLCICARVWSSICQLDDQESGTWPPHAFSLLLISFLQRMRPYPVLPFLQPTAAKSSSTGVKMDEEPVLVAETTDPSAGESEERSHAEDEEMDEIEGVTWVSKNTDSVGKLWLSFLRYYGLQFRAGVDVVSVRRPPDVDRELSHLEKGWGTRILAIEEPFRPWLNLSRSVGSREIFSHFLHLIRQTYVYFTTPQLQEGPAFKMSNFEVVYRQPNRRRLASNSALGPEFRYDLVSHEERNGQEFCDDDEEEDREADGDDRSDDSEAPADDSSLPFRIATHLSRKHGIYLQLSPDVQSSLEKLDPRKLKYRFNFSTLDWFRNIKKFCHSCRKSGHTARVCPTESLPRIVELPKTFPPDVLSFHSRIYHSLFQEERISDEARTQHEEVRRDLLALIRNRLIPDAELQLFGSCVNGFGSSSSDMDLCLTLASDPTGKSLDQKRLENMIHDLGKLLHSHDPVLKSSILPIVHAKVPIVKFTYVLLTGSGRRREIQCDLSLYNVLGCCNTRLLRSYCQLDSRVPVLGFVVKHFAKTCDIADASRGSLSSYAYTLMTIHFLQRVGVVPVLQEMGWTAVTPGGKAKAPEVLVEGWNTWFLEDLDAVRRSWHPKTDACVASLFIRFLQYYAQEFSFSDYVVCCRRSQPLTRLEKMWTGKRIAIEDPFLLTHNLGAGLAPQMATFIQSSLILAHNHFGQALAYVKPPPTPQLPVLMPPDAYQHPAIAAALLQDRQMKLRAIEELHQQQLRNEIAFLFNPKMLTNGSLPTGRGCRLCGRIAHRVKDCPLRRTTRPGGHQGQVTGRTFACFACGSPHHKVNACPQSQRGPVGQSNFRQLLPRTAGAGFRNNVHPDSPFAARNGVRSRTHQETSGRNATSAPVATAGSQQSLHRSAATAAPLNQGSGAGAPVSATKEPATLGSGFRRLTFEQLTQQRPQTSADVGTASPQSRPQEPAIRQSEFSAQQQEKKTKVRKANKAKGHSAK